MAGRGMVLEFGLKATLKVGLTWTSHLFVHESFYY